LQVVQQAFAHLPSNPLGLSSDFSSKNGALSPIVTPLLASPLPTFNESDYPNVRWWTKKKWNERADASEGVILSLDDNGSQSAKRIRSTDYLEDKDGNPISEEDRKSLYHHAQLIWNEFVKMGDPPAGYTQVNIQYLTQYRNEMEKEFPFLNYCSRHWKADHVWILNYPSWIRNRGLKDQRSKDKQVKSEDHIDKKTPADSGSKRKREEDVTIHKKAMLPNVDDKENYNINPMAAPAPTASPSRPSEVSEKIFDAHIEDVDEGDLHFGSAPICVNPL
jgi:hypothetical protein